MMVRPSRLGEPANANPAPAAVSQELAPSRSPAPAGGFDTSYLRIWHPRARLVFILAALGDKLVLAVLALEAVTAASRSNRPAWPRSHLLSE